MDKNGYPNNLEQKGKPKKVSRSRNQRFLTALDMAEAKRLEAVHNAQFNRGEKPTQHTDICQCGCGMETCLFTYSTTEPAIKTVSKNDPKPNTRAWWRKYWDRIKADNREKRERIARLNERLEQATDEEEIALLKGLLGKA